MDRDPGDQQRASLRASDADREQFVEALRQHHAEGRLTLEELTERTGRAYAARTLGDLDALGGDLPPLQWYGMVTLVLSGLLPTEQARFLLTDMTYRLVVGYGDTPSVARPSVEKGMRGTPETPARGNPVSETGGIPEAITGMGGSQ